MLTDFLTILAACAVWYILMRFLLPALGVPTCMSGACRIDKHPTDPKKESKPHD